MNSITPEYRIQLYTALPDHLKDIYSSEKTVRLQSELITKFNIENEGTYIDLIGDTILGLIEEKNLRLRLEHLRIVAPEHIDALLGELLPYIRPALEYQKNPGPKAETVTVVTPLRTMETDAKKIHGYGAFRDAEPRADDVPVYRSEQANLVPPPSYIDDSSTPKSR